MSSTLYISSFFIYNFFHPKRSRVSLHDFYLYNLFHFYLHTTIHKNELLGFLYLLNRSYICEIFPAFFPLVWTKISNRHPPSWICAHARDRSAERTTWTLRSGKNALPPHPSRTWRELSSRGGISPTRSSTLPRGYDSSSRNLPPYSCRRWPPRHSSRSNRCLRSRWTRDP